MGNGFGGCYNLHVIPIGRLSIPYMAAGDMERSSRCQDHRKDGETVIWRDGCKGSLILPFQDLRSRESPLLFHFRSPDMLEHLPEVFEFLADMYFSFFRSTIQFGSVSYTHLRAHETDSY